MEIDLKNLRDASSWLCKKKERKKERKKEWVEELGDSHTDLQSSTDNVDFRKILNLLGLHYQFNDCQTPP